MLSKLRTILFAAGFMAVGAASTIAIDAAAGPGPRMQALVADMDLTADQQEELDAIRDEMRDFRQGMHENRGSMRELFSMLGEDEIDAKEVHANIDATIEERARSIHALADRLIEFHASLSPEQRAEMADRIEDLQANRGERMGRRGQGHGGPGYGGDCPNR